MAWLWDSWEEYSARVRPTEVRIGRFKQSRLSTAFQAHQDLLSAASILNESLNRLREAGFVAGHRTHSKSTGKPIDLITTVAQLIRAGEELLLYHKRLALSSVSYGFLHINDLLEHWDRYRQNDRINFEIQQLMKDVGGLLDGFHQMQEDDESLLVGQIDLPEPLERDFRLARNLFSVGFEETALLVAGRGLEGVLREIARKRQIMLEVKGKSTPASEADFFDLIEIMSRVRWKSNGEALVPRATKALLHFLRVTRNGGAHPSASAGTQECRETAIVVARTADRLWNSIASRRAKVEPTTVQKGW